MRVNFTDEGDGCDFCDKTIQAVKTYPCRDFVVSRLVGPGKPTLQLNSKGYWKACEACVSLIDSDNRKALYERALQLITYKQLGVSYSTLPPHHQDELRASVFAIHNGFFENRIKE